MAPAKTVYLRCVTRVYLVGGVAVSLTNTDSQGAKLSGGVNPPTVSILKPGNDANANYSDLLAQLSNQANGTSQNPPASTVTNALTSAAQIGGSVQFTQASSLGVSLNETFDRPLVFGYLGFDIAVDKDGELGPRVPTFQVLKPTRRVTINNDIKVTYVDPSADASAIEAWLKLDDANRSRHAALRAWLAARNKSSITTWLYGGNAADYTVARHDLSIP